MVSTDASVARCHRGKGQRVGPYCIRTETRTRRNGSGTSSMVKHVLREADDRKVTTRHRCHRQVPRFAEKPKSGIQKMFVDKKTRLPQNNKIPSGSTIPTGNGKIGAVRKVGLSRAHRQQDGEDFFQSSERQTRPLTPEEPGENAIVVSGDRQRDDERVLHDLSRGRGREVHLNTSPHASFSALSCTAYSQWHALNFCLCSTSFV